MGSSASLWAVSMRALPLPCRMQGRAFALYSKAREGATQVTADDAIRQAQQALLQVGALCLAGA